MSTNGSRMEHGAETGTQQGQAPIFEAEIVEDCESVIERYRRGEIEHDNAIFDLTDILRPPDSSDISQDEARARRAGLYTFISRLAEIDTVRNEQDSVPLLRLGQHTLAPRRYEDEVFEEERYEEANEEVIPRGQGDKQASKSSGRVRQRKRRRYEDSDDEDAREEIDVSLFPFDTDSDDTSISECAAKTLRLRENYMRDIKYAKKKIICARGCPDVPDFIWNDILPDRYHDFNKSFTAFYSISGDHRDTYTFGELEFTGSSTKPSREIRTHGDWITTFQTYRKAVLFAYPHRGQELDNYFEYISRQFAVVHPSQIARVINFDRAVRSFVARSNHLTFDDAPNLQSLYTQYFSAAGISASQYSSGSKLVGQRRNQDVRCCHRFNEDRCHSTTCIYPHICIFCSSKAHSGTHCPNRDTESNRSTA